MRRSFPVVRAICVLLIAALATVPGQIAFSGQVDLVLNQKLQSTPAMEMVRVLVTLSAQVDLGQMERMLKEAVPAGQRVSPEFRYRTVLSALQNVSENTQPALMERIAPYVARGTAEVHYQFWIRNMVVVSATPDVIREIAAMPDVETVMLDGLLQRDLPVAQSEGVSAPEASEPGLRAINAHRLWALGFNGAGRIVMNIDTGVMGNNLAFNSRWRGTLPGVPASAAWFDPETSTSFPTDGDASSQHGTHTMGTMCGLYTSTNDTLGVAPGAYWIAAKTLNSSPHTSRSIAAFQWAANPDGNPGTIDDVPDAISCSWYDPNVASTQCDAAGGYAAVIDAVEALGTAVVFSAGNGGPGASTLTPPKNRNVTAANIFAVGAVNGNTAGYPIASFSSRGPSTCPGPDSLRIKPEVSAPGVSVRSAAGTNGFRTLDGTSMASPHVAGSIALLRSVAPFLTGTELKYILMETAADLGPAGEDNDYGHGIIDLWAAYLALPLNMGYVKGQVTSSGSPLTGVKVDFAESVLQLSGMTDAGGNYKASARIDTPFTSAQYTIRAQKFGYLTFTDTLTLVLGDTVTRNISLSPAPGGTLSVHAYRNDMSGIRANVKVIFGGIPVVDDYTDSTTGMFTAPLPAGSYDVIVDPPSPYGTKTFTAVTITAGQTTTVDALVRYVIEPSPTALLDTLVVGQIRAQTLTLTNTTADDVPFRITDDNALRMGIRPRPAGKPVRVYDGYELPKGAVDTHEGIGGVDGRGGPDAFGYQWVDSDEPDGPVFNWVDISGVGTPITTWTGSGDDGRAIVSLPFSFPYYGVNYNQVKIVTNGWIGFDVVSTSNAYSNVAIPATADPNTAVYLFWDDLTLAASGSVHYYDDAANSRFIVQYTNVPHYGTTPGLYTFQVHLYPNGNMLLQYLDMQQTLNSATIGIENETGTDGLQVVFNSAYVHNNLAISFRLPDATWISENPVVGTIPAGGSQPVTVTFDATDLTVGTNYNANVFVTATHPDVSAPIGVPATLSVQLADSAVLILSQGSLTFPAQQINTTVSDTLTIRNGGLQTLNVSSITSTSTLFAVSPSSATLAPNDSVWVVVAYTPTTVGADTGRIVFLSNSQGSPRIDVILSGTAIGAPAITLDPTSLADTLQVGDNSTLTFTITNATPLPTTPLYVTLEESATWMSVTPTADTLAGGASETFTVALDATGLPLGSVSADITIASNDPATPTTALTVNLLVVGGPVIVVMPDSLYKLVAAGATVVDTFVIRNEGVSALNWSLSEMPAAPPQKLSESPAPPAVEMPKDMDHPGTSGPVTEGQGGPDGYGYRWIDSDEPGGPTFNWVDITAVGTPITTWTGSGDDGRAIVPIPFSFPFYGTGYTQLKVVTNGWISFDVVSTNNTFSNTAIPAPAEPNLSVYPWWDDLDVRTQGSVHYYHDAANNRFIVQYTNVPHYGTTTPGVYTFQVILNASGSVLCQYLDMQQTLNSATIGIENATGTDGLQVVYNADYMHNNLAILFSRGISWLTEEPTSGSVAPGDSAKVAVTFNSTGMTGGIYNGTLQITSNDYTNSPKDVPVVLHVIGVPGISAPAAIPFGTVFVGDTARINLVVKNVGSDILEVSGFAVTGSGAFTMNLSPATIGIGDSLVRACTFIPTAAVPYAATCMIFSNDPDDDTVTVALSGAGSVAPSGSVWPTSITRSIPTNTIDSTSTFTIRNAGGSPLVWEIAEVPGPTAASPLQGFEAPVPQSATSDAAVTSLRFQENSLALGDTLFSFDVTSQATPPANVILGVEFALDHYWVTGRGTTDNVKKIYKYNRDFALVASYNQTTTSPTFGYRDMAFDGQHLYAGDESGVHKIDPATGARLALYPLPSGQSVIRSLAFDPATRTFWTKNFGGALVHFDSTGAILGSFTNPLATYGLAWDSWSPGGPFLWSFSQDGPTGGQLVTATQINPANGQNTGVSFLGPNLSTTVGSPDIAGGVTITNALDPTRLVMVALHQSDPTDKVVGYDLNLTLGLPWVDASITSGSTPNGDSTVVRAIFNTTGMGSGSHHGRFQITTNDPLMPVMHVDLNLDVLVSVNEDRRGVPVAFELSQNYPNPFNPATRIEYGIPEGATVTLRVYDVLGREIRTLFDGSQDGGFYTAEWDGRNSAGVGVASGLYFYRLEATTHSGRTFTAMNKMLLMK